MISSGVYSRWINGQCADWCFQLALSFEDVDVVGSCVGLSSLGIVRRSGSLGNWIGLFRSFILPSSLINHRMVTQRQIATSIRANMCKLEWRSVMKSKPNRVDKRPKKERSIALIKPRFGTTGWGLEGKIDSMTAWRIEAIFLYFSIHDFLDRMLPQIRVSFYQTFLQVTIHQFGSPDTSLICFPDRKSVV